MSTSLDLWRLLDRKQRRAFLWLQGVAVLMAFTTLVGVAALVPFLLSLTDRQRFASLPAVAAFYRTLGFESQGRFSVALGVGFVVAVMLANLVNLLGARAMTRFALEVGDGFHAALLDEYLSRDLKNRASCGAGALFNRVIYAVNRVATGLIDGTLQLIANALSVLVICASLVWLNPRIVLAALTWIGCAYLLTYALARRKLGRDGALERALVERRAAMAREALRAAKELQTSERQGTFAERFDQVCRSLSRIWLSNQLIAQSPRYVLESATFAGLVGAVLLMSDAGAAGAWLPQLSFLALATYRLLPAVHMVFASAVRIRAVRAFFEDLLPDLRVALSRRRRAPAAVSEVFRSCPCREIRLERVTVRFDGQLAPALDDVSLVIPAGSMIGLVGANASGKTTLADVIAGLLAPDRGRLSIDGICVDDANRTGWRRQIAYVAQEVFLLDASIAENIAFGVPARDIDRERVTEAARLAGLSSQLARLPHGIDAPVAEEGLRLSGGYRQRVAIARAFYRRAPLLVLDEATSSMDNLSEQELVEVLERMRGRCTLVLVAHRLSMLRNCDRIFELAAGRLVAQGSHDEMCGREDASSVVVALKPEQVVER
jgi:HlyD family secretion protein